MHKNSALKLVCKILAKSPSKPKMRTSLPTSHLCWHWKIHMSKLQNIQLYVQDHGMNWTQLILINNRIPNYQNLKHTKTSQADSFLIWKLNSENTHISSRESSRRRCEAVSLLIMKHQLKQTGMMGEGSTRCPMHINVRLTLNKQWNPWQWYQMHGPYLWGLAKERGLDSAYSNVHDIIILNIKGSHCAIWREVPCKVQNQSVSVELWKHIHHKTIVCWLSLFRQCVNDSPNPISLWKYSAKICYNISSHLHSGIFNL